MATVSETKAERQLNKVIIETNKFLGKSLIYAGSYIWSGFVLTVLWGWFMAPTFHLPNLNIPQGLGIALIFGWLTGHYSNQTEQKVTFTDPNNGRNFDAIFKPVQLGFWPLVGYKYGVPLVFLAFGWAYHFFL